MLFDSPFDDNIAFVTLGPDDLPSATLLPDERSLLSDQAVPKRIKEFTLGRTAARQALKKLGITDSVAIGRGAKREPLWPEGIVGSITHSKDIAMAAVAKKQHVRALGIDLEKSSRKSSIDISEKIALPSELDWIAGSDLRLMMLFSAKEALFKAIFPIYGDYFWHHQAELSWSAKDNAFLATLDFSPAPELGAESSFRIQVDQKNGFILSSMLIKYRLPSA